MSPFLSLLARLFRDLLPLLGGQCLLLVATLVIFPGNSADLRVQAVWTGFLACGWLVAPVWVGEHVALLRRYLAAMVSSIALHGLLVALGSLSVGTLSLGSLSGLFGMRAYLTIWIAMTLAAAAIRLFQMARSEPPQLRLPKQHLLVVITLVLFCVCVYRTPRSNDIHQFLLQQQDMLAEASLQVSTIGMTAMEVDQPMPRWKAHSWHLVPCLIAYASGIAVDQVLLRYATIPVAFSVLLCLIESIRALTGKRTSHVVIMFAILGSVLLWFRNYNAFNYSFRITNNLLLDKDFALFCLIPATLWLAKGWIQGRQRFRIPLLALVPALIRFHPLTAVYLLLLAVPFTFLVARSYRNAWHRVLALFVASVVLFIIVVVLGDAQSNHAQIRQIIQLDYDQSVAQSRPLHYWDGFYNVVPGSTVPSDTTQWTDGRLGLKSSLITGCGLLIAMHVALLILLVKAVIRTPRMRFLGPVTAGAITVLMLWGMWLVSTMFLTRFPHYTAGYERLHWFAYPIAIAVVATAITEWTTARFRRPLEWMLLAFVATSALWFRFDQTTPLVHARGLNSLLDLELAADIIRRRQWAQIPSARTLEDLRPEAFNNHDRALLLDLESTRNYWLIRQGVFWADPYVEAFAWFHRGDEFLIDRAVFYDLLDRRDVEALPQWLKQKGITLIIDRRAGGDAALAAVALRHGLPIQRLSTGVWRIIPDPSEQSKSNLSVDEAADL